MAPPGAGGPFGESGASLSEVVSYVRAHGGGTIGVSSQQGAATQVIAGAKVAGLGGFSGRESEVSVRWLADAVQSGRIRWVLVDGAGSSGPGADGRVGASRLMAAVTGTCAPAETTTGGTLYDCAGHASALRAW